MENKKKIKIKKVRGPNRRSQIEKTIEEEEDILEDGDFVLDGYHVAIDKEIQCHNDDLNTDFNDYEHKQEEYGFQSEDLQPIALDRFIERIGKGRKTPR